MQANVTVTAFNTDVVWTDGTRTVLPNIWLRDNCACSDCCIEQTNEKKFLVTAVPENIQPSSAKVDEGELKLNWPDGHTTTYKAANIRALLHTECSKVETWNSEFRPHSVSHSSFLADDLKAAEAIEHFLISGALIISDMPTTSGAVETLQSRLGPIREMPFGRIHEVRVDPSGYNVAHTALPLPPHTDFASTNWPPSIQALHMLVNQCEGGASVIVDGWAVINAMREEHSEMFDTLCTVPVPFRMFSENEETYAVNPLIRLDPQGEIVRFRYSNQLMQTMNPHTPGIHQFYRAYRELTRRLMSDDARAVFRLDGGQCLLVAGHRVLHAREGFEPTGQRHLQDAYFEHDCCRNHLTVIRRRLENTQ